MKRNWEYKKLGDVCVSKSGIGRALKTFESNDEILYIDIASIDNQKHSITSYTQTKLSEAPSRAQQCVKKEDILVSLVRPNLKNVAIVGDDENNLVASSGFCVLRAGEDLLPQYVFQFVCSDKFTDYLVGLTAGANYPAVREDDVRNAIVPIPPLSEQSRIVAELDLLTGIIDKQNAQLKELDNLAQAIFYDMFGDPIENEKGWEVKKLGDEMKVVGGYAFKSDCFVNAGIPVLRIGNINSGVLKINQIVFYTENEKLAKYIVYPNDLVISLTGTAGKDDYGNICKLGDCYPKYYLNQRNAKLDLGNNLQACYVQYLFKDKTVKGTLIAVNRGVRQGNISNKDIEGLNVPVPPLALQQQFADKIQSIENQKAKIKASIVETQKLLDYTMDKYFG